MPRLEIATLGPPEIRLEGQPGAGLASNKVRALLYYLAVESGRPHRRESLAGLLWPDYPERSARTNLSNALSNLRAVLHDRDIDCPTFDVSREAIQFSAEGDCWVDAVAFEAFVDRGSWEEAVSIYHGPFLEGFSLADSPAFEQWTLVVRERLQRQMMVALEACSAACEGRGDYRGAIAAVRRQLEIEPWHEPAHRALMRLCAASGQRAAALRQYAECERMLRKELGAAPERETVQLYEAIHRGSYTALAVAGPPDTRLGNLPVSLSSFVGRVRELDELAGLIHAPSRRLVTVVGPGGMGKTRLALEAAQAALACYPGGAWLVELAPVPAIRGAAEDAAVPRAVAAVLGVHEQPGRSLPDVIAGALKGRELLLVLDNCEHVLTGVAPLVALLLARCPQLGVLATSREPLRVAGEHLYDVPGMEVPASRDLSGFPKPDRSVLSYDALELFAQRAAAVRPGFVLDEENGTVVADLCCRLDGMPLAIELAAARLRALSLPELARRLDERFRLLTGGSRAALPRQQTLRDTVAWSYDLLSERERLLFDRLSVFAGSFSLGGAEAVCSGEGIHKEEVLELLARLVDQSLVGRAEGPGGTTRYRLLETLRAYGQERLARRGETERVAARHAWYYVSLAEATEPVFHEYEREMIDVQRRLDAEADNLASAVEWALARRQPEMALRIGGPLHFWTMYRPHYAQYAEWMRQALTQEAQVAPLYRAKAWELISGRAYNWGRYEEAGVAAQAELASARAAGDPHWIARGLYWVGLYLQATGQHKEARTCFQESRSLARQCSDTKTAGGTALSLAEYEPLGRRRLLLEEILRQAPYAGRPYGLQFLVRAVQAQGDLKGAEAYLRESLAGWREAGSVLLQGILSTWLGQIHALCGDYAGAQGMMERGRALVRQVGNDRDVVRATLNLGNLAWRQGKFDTAMSRYQEALELAHQHGYLEHAALAGLGLALVGAELGDYERAKALCAEALPDVLEWDNAGQVLALYVRGWVVGGQLDPDKAALALCVQGKTALLGGDGARAVALYRQALERARRSESRPDTVELIECLAWALAADAQAGAAACLLALAGREREEMGMVLPPVDRPHHERALETVQDALGEAGLAAAWAEGEAVALEVGVERALAAHAR